MRFAGDIFDLPGGKIIKGADREARGFIKEIPWTLGAVGYGLKGIGALDQPAPGLRGKGAVGGLVGGLF